ncbi:16S rRNA (cytosine(1402)-N(4))-methyltransferase RsmH [Helicobacter burdigaliensis]|uniref:16S rRNA (cytosine(1402)-N(4))-methyltransferase RsmH n=1 Tax=Helicobacter burdigaliensis TaxID=2315334 RepID=UPI000EF70D34|nr:16S rRNA (cytosine(1402)-N(4))-methyltransferase RsmH [Helicobacter burdigaliensis]
MNSPHISVLPCEVLQSFDTPLVHKGGILLDCTLGFGGHTSMLLKAYPKLQIIGIDKDREALEFCNEFLAPFKDRFTPLYGDFSIKALEILKKEKLVGVLADIGVSSLQFDKEDRGFSFKSNTLDMRMDKNKSLSAKDIINSYSLVELERIFRDYGEIREYKKLARLIVEWRKEAKIISAQELSSKIAMHFKASKIHPATLAFQALRIEVNDELGELERLLRGIFENPLQKGARVSIISFHSLEDRIVKEHFKRWEKSCICPMNVMRCECGNNHALGKSIYKKPLIATSEENMKNPRARSAKLRTFEFGK